METNKLSLWNVYVPVYHVAYYLSSVKLLYKITLKLAEYRTNIVYILYITSFVCVSGFVFVSGCVTG